MVGLSSTAFGHLISLCSARSGPISGEGTGHGAVTRPLLKSPRSPKATQLSHSPGGYGSPTRRLDATAVQFAAYSTCTLFNSTCSLSFSTCSLLHSTCSLPKSQLHLFTPSLHLPVHSLTPPVPSQLHLFTPNSTSSLPSPLFTPILHLFTPSLSLFTPNSSCSLPTPPVHSQLNLFTPNSTCSIAAHSDTWLPPARCCRGGCLLDLPSRSHTSHAHIRLRQITSDTSGPQSQAYHLRHLRRTPRFLSQSSVSGRRTAEAPHRHSSPLQLNCHPALSCRQPSTLPSLPSPPRSRGASGRSASRQRPAPVIVGAGHANSFDKPVSRRRGCCCTCFRSGRVAAGTVVLTGQRMQWGRRARAHCPRAAAANSAATCYVKNGARPAGTYPARRRGGCVYLSRPPRGLRLTVWH